MRKKILGIAVMAVVAVAAAWNINQSENEIKLYPLAELSQCILDSSNGSIINVI